MKLLRNVCFYFSGSRGTSPELSSGGQKAKFEKHLQGRWSNLSGHIYIYIYQNNKTIVL